MSWGVYVVLVLCISFCVCQNDVTTSKCKFPTHKSTYKGFEVLKKLEGQNFFAQDESKKYIYYFRICDKPDVPQKDAVVHEDSGLVQYSLESKSSKTVGKFTSAEVVQGSGWLFLQYEDGDTYAEACDKKPRRGSIMFMCPTNRTAQPVFRVLEENVDRKDDNCYYLFELEHPAICDIPTTVIPSTGMSPWTIVFLVLVSSATMYLCVGMAYKRLAFGSRGCAMIPNNRMWQKVGIKFSDGCDWLCRCRNCDGSDHPYLPANHPVHSTNNGNQYHTSPLPALVLSHDDFTAPGYNHFDIREQPHSNVGASNLSSDEGDLYRDDQLLQV